MGDNVCYLCEGCDLRCESERCVGLASTRAERTHQLHASPSLRRILSAITASASASATPHPHPHPLAGEDGGGSRTTVRSLLIKTDALDDSAVCRAAQSDTRRTEASSTALASATTLNAQLLEIYDTVTIHQRYS